MYNVFGPHFPSSYSGVKIYGRQLGLRSRLSKLSNFWTYCIAGNTNTTNYNMTWIEGKKLPETTFRQISGALIVTGLVQFALGFSGIIG